MDQLIVTPLQEGRINRDDRLQTLACHAGGKCHCVLFGNADVVITLRKATLEFDHARTFTHGGRNTYQAFISSRHIAQPVAEDAGVSHFLRHNWLDTFSRVEFTRAVIQHRIRFRQFVALTFFSHDMQELRTFQVFQILQGRDQGIQIMPVYRTDVIKAEFFKHRRWHDHAFCVFFKTFCQLAHRRRQHGLADVFRRSIKLTRHQTRKITIQCANWRRDRHIVVVQHDQQINIVVNTGVVHCLEGHTSGHRAVANHGNRMPVFALGFSGQRHPQCSRDRGR